MLMIGLPSALIGISLFFIVLLWGLPKWQARSIIGLESKDRFDRENEARKTLSQILGGFVLIVGFYSTWQSITSSQENLRITFESQITDRFTKAISQLGDTKLEIRLGAIYALERIARDSPRDEWSIMEVLTAYAREHAKVKTPKKNLPKTKAESPEISEDIEAILSVIARRRLTYQKGEDQRLDLRNTDLRGADLVEAGLSGADFTKADLDEADVSGSDLGSAFLLFANLSGVNLKNSVLLGAHLEGANLTAADLHGADLRGANFTGAKGLSSDQLESAKGNAETTLPEGLARPKSWQ